ncbi:NADP-dependent oxidoreductase [Streptomyces sp. NPDC004667]|uniref:NADP-dependent oxidoreductase n=1 Tax=Streptomyces sp. NPDC004667 TaxID=3154285 RepID=UPI0033B2F710
MGTTTMRAVRVHAFGGPEQLVHEEVPRPVAGPGEVLVRVHAAGVNPVDWYGQRNFAALPEPLRPEWPLPYTPGSDVSGTIVETGAGVTGWRAGDEVFGLVRFPGRASAYAEYVVSPAGNLARKPAALGHTEAAAVPMAGLTAYQYVFEHVKVGEGDTVLVNGAAGGVGHFAVQLARAAGAGRVVAVASGRHEAFLLGLGADGFVDYTRTAAEEAVRGVDVLIDAVGGPDGHRLLPVMRPGGRIGAVFPGEYHAERAAAQGVSAGVWQVRPNGGQLAELARLADSGALRVAVEEVFPLAGAARAHARAERGHLQGKIVLDVAPAH